MMMMWAMTRDERSFLRFYTKVSEKDAVCVVCQEKEIVEMMEKKVTMRVELSVLSFFPSMMKVVY
jgi:hypothetical protein